MTKPHSPSSWAASSLSCVSSSSGSCYVPPPSWSPECSSKKKRSGRRRAKNGAAVAPRRTSSIYKGVTRHRGTGKYEAHLWDKNAWNRTKTNKGRQVYLGAFDNEEAAARTYDLAALKYWGSNSTLNFPVESYMHEYDKMQRMTREAYLATLRRKSSCFSRGISGYRGVAKHHHSGRWEARIGYAHGKKYVYLGTFGTQEDAARAYDLAALELRGPAAVTNFDLSSYTDKAYQQPAVRKTQPKPALKPKDEPVDEDEASPLPRAPHPVAPPPLLTPKPEPGYELGEPLALQPGPVLRDADDVDHAIAEILPALCMDPADFEARYPARRGAGALVCPPPDDQLLRGLALPDSVRFEDCDIETLFDAPGGEVHVQMQERPDAAGAVAPDVVSGADADDDVAAATIRSLASARWWP